MHCGDRWGSLVIDRGITAQQRGCGNTPECRGNPPEKHWIHWAEGPHWDNGRCWDRPEDNWWSANGRHLGDPGNKRTGWSEGGHDKSEGWAGEQPGEALRCRQLEIWSRNPLGPGAPKTDGDGRRWHPTRDLRSNEKASGRALRHWAGATGKALKPLHEQRSPPVPDQQNSWDHHEDKTLAERIRTLFREQGITIVSILTAIGMAISTLVLALAGGGAGGTPSPAPKPSDKGGVKEWVKKDLQALGRSLANLAGKAAATLPRIIGSIVSWVLSTLGKTTTWLTENLWALVIGVGPSF